MPGKRQCWNVRRTWLVELVGVRPTTLSKKEILSCMPATKVIKKKPVKKEATVKKQETRNKKQGKETNKAKVIAVTKKATKKTAVVKKVKVPAVPRGKEAKPTTMEELLASTGYELKAPKPGETVKGVVTDVSKRMVLIDMGAKTEGMVVDREYEAARDYAKELAVGDEVTAYVVSPENDRGQILLSLKRALVDKRWAQFAEYMETGEAVEVSGLEVNKGGMIVATDSIRGFVPSSQFGKEYLGRMDRLLSQKFRVKVIEVDKEKNRLIFSERHVSEAEAISKKAEALKFVKAKDKYDGVVSGVMPFGGFWGVG